TAHNNSGVINTSTFDNLSITGNTSAALPPTVARLTDGDFGEANTIFFNNRVGITSFTTSFTYQVAPRVGSADGIAFVLQGIGATARGGGGGGLGYTGIGRSVAVKFDIWTSDTHRSTTGIYFDGEAVDSPAGRARQIFMDTDPDPANRIDFNNGHVFRIDLTYDGATLTETVTDTVTGATFSTSYDVDIAAHVGSNVGYVGLSGGTGGQTAVQDVLTWVFASDAPFSPGAAPGGGSSGSAGDVAWLISGPSATGGFRLNTGVPAANSTESRAAGLADLTA